MELLFVYGLLRYGFSLHRYLSIDDFVGLGFVEGFELYDTGLYPVAVRGSGRVWGEVYRVDRRALNEIDRVEAGYVREAVKVSMAGCIEECGLLGPIDAWMYVYEDSTGEFKRVPSGDYTVYKGKEYIINYFAYGPSLDLARLESLNVKPLRSLPARLEGYMLVFNKRCAGGACANIELDARSTVYGALYTITSKHMKALDKHEGYPQHYWKITVRVTGLDDNEYYAMTYMANPSMKVSVGRPSKSHIYHIIAGLEQHGWKLEAVKLRKVFQEV